MTYEYTVLTEMELRRRYLVELTAQAHLQTAAMESIAMFMERLAHPMHVHEAAPAPVVVDPSAPVAIDGCIGDKLCTACKTFVCTRCQQLRPWCVGASDTYPDWCDDCVQEHGADGVPVEAALAALESEGLVARALETGPPDPEVAELAKEMEQERNASLGHPRGCLCVFCEARREKARRMVGG